MDKLTLIAIPIILLIASIGFTTITPAFASDWCDEVSTVCDTSWGFRKKITIQNGQVIGTTAFTDFPILITFGGTDFTDVEDEALTSGGDLRFTDEHGTILQYEIEEYDETTNELFVWVKADFEATSDTDFYIYYGKAGAVSISNKTDVWRAAYEAVYHLNDDFLDSTSNVRTATNEDTTDIGSHIADGQDWNSSDEIELGTWSVTGDQMTVSAWYNPDTFVNDGRIFAKAVGSAAESHVVMLSGFGTNEDELRFRMKTGTSDSSGTTTLICSGNAMSTGTWQHVIAWYDGTTASEMRVYKDKVENCSTGKSGDLRINTWKWAIGSNPDAGSPVDGQIDEMRVLSEALSEDYMDTEYNNIFTPATFLSISAEETPPAPSDPNDGIFGFNCCFIFIVIDWLQNISLSSWMPLVRII